jgi:uncharacterized membrane protein YfcA
MDFAFVNAVLSTMMPILLGLFVGAVLAVTGAGGAILAIPLLMFFMQISIGEAAPIGLFALAIAASMASMIGLKKGLVRYKSAVLMAGLGMLVAPLGVWLSARLPVAILSIAFAAVLILVGSRILVDYVKHRDNDTLIISQTCQQETLLPSPTESKANNKLAAPCQINPMTSRLFWTARCTLRLSVTGVMAGLLSGLLGVGGGFVIVPALSKVSNFNMATIIATSLTVVALVSSVGFASYAFAGHIDWSLAFIFAASTVSGLMLVNLFAHRIPSQIAQLGFAVFAIVIAINMVAQAIGA